MSAAVKSLLREFDQLSNGEKHALTTQIFRRIHDMDWPALTDTQLTKITDDAFRRLDQDEARHAKHRSR